MAHWRAISSDARRRAAETWLAAFGAAMTQRDSARVASMMHSAGYWRDLLAFGWDFKTLRGPEAVKAWLTKSLETRGLSAVRLDGEPAAGAIGDHSETLEFFFTFETRIANGRGFVRLVPDPRAADGASIFTMLTTAMELKDYPEAVGRKRRREDSQAGKRAVLQDFKESDPEVVIVGGGQSGLMSAARLRQLDVSTLVIEKTGRVGDVWRNRYRTLKLHNEICMNHFAYMPYPDTWPVYLPKDKVADWMEFYAESMDLDVWTGTAFLGGTFDEDTNRWTVRLRTADGATRVMRPSHVILAVGVSGIASIPQIAGADEFAGQILHSSSNTDSLDAAGKSVVVVGAGTSGHDIAQDMVGRGADVTMVQRSPITVVSLEPSSVRAYELYRANDGVRPIADTDMMAASVPYELLAQLHKPLNRQMAEDDKELLDGLRRAGFLIENGDDDPGYFLKLLKSQSGYYLNVGASDLIISGKIKIKAGVGVQRLTKKAVIFSDGSAVPADIVVLATGYEPLQEAARAMFGDDVADRVGPIWGVGTDGELRNMYGRTAQQGLHVLGGGFPAARVYSRFTAILIKATLEGLLPPRPSPQRTASTLASEPELNHA
jgi:putative flavoprotein involved in K+ transport